MRFLIIFAIGALFYFSQAHHVQAVGSKQNFGQAKIKLPRVLGASTYNIYYKESGNKKYEHAIRTLPANVENYTIGFLKKGVAYSYAISALDRSGKEFSFSKPTNLLSR